MLIGENYSRPHYIPSWEVIFTMSSIRVLYRGGCSCTNFIAGHYLLMFFYSFLHLDSMKYRVLVYENELFVLFKYKNEKKTMNVVIFFLQHFQSSDFVRWKGENWTAVSPDCCLTLILNSKLEILVYYLLTCPINTLFHWYFGYLQTIGWGPHEYFRMLDELNGSSQPTNTVNPLNAPAMEVETQYQQEEHNDGGMTLSEMEAGRK